MFVQKQTHRATYTKIEKKMFQFYIPMKFHPQKTTEIINRHKTLASVN